MVMDGDAGELESGSQEVTGDELVVGLEEFGEDGDVGWVDWGGGG